LDLRAEVERNYISLFELGRNSPSVQMEFRLCEALKVSTAVHQYIVGALMLVPLTDVEPHTQLHECSCEPEDLPRR